MSEYQRVSGDDWIFTVTRKTSSGSAVPIDAMSTVKAVVAKNGVAVTGEVSLSSSSPADWPNGVIYVVIPKEETVKVSADLYEIEIQVSEPARTSTYCIPNVIVKESAIP